ncbi:SDR family NAD(P)-dependent oxidoreductase [Streptomyces sp. XM4193]|uniref:SDR family NAD(P)-dependent oxidoreductase n=1 Tax=Streptomyces sp. XM4193 TaxID=2929782 RepID=UPI001FF918A8|nr:SDR family NAD(P)-dependent oxidoreductase [Streptomyces sp. XM4193]MCK1798940.1 SDR family NAD(P)-dependent oxidoreductase [Streptomyces sp. XM4193]
MSLRVLITGGSSGLGRALVARYLADGHRVLVGDLLPPEDPGGAEHLKLDVTDPEDWRRARTWCETNWGGLDVLVNNAGVAAAGRLERIEQEDWDWILDINLHGTVLGCRTFIPLLKEQGSGHLVNVASLAGLMNLPGMSSYNVSKAAVISLSETLRHELAPWHIRTSVICPGFVPTRLNSGLRSPDPVLARLADHLIRHGSLTPEQLADRAVRAVAKGRFLINTHREGRIAVAVKRLLPALADRRIGRQWLRTKAKLDAQDLEAEAAQPAPAGNAAAPDAPAPAGPEHTGPEHTGPEAGVREDVTAAGRAAATGGTAPDAPRGTAR